MKNTIENIIIALIVFIVGSFAGGFIGYKAAVNAIGSQKEIIQQAIDKNTSEIQNTFSTEIKKLKNKNGNTDLTTSPKMENQMENVNEQARYYRERNWRLFNRKK